VGLLPGPDKPALAAGGTLDGQTVLAGDSMAVDSMAVDSVAVGSVAVDSMTVVADYELRKIQVVPGLAGQQLCWNRAI